MVLAGGRSERFGWDKLAEPVEGVPMLHHAIRAVAPFCDEMVVSVAFEGKAPPMPEDVAVVLVRDRVPDEGPLAGLCTALGLVSTPLALVAAGDMPRLSSAVLGLMLREAVSHPDAQVVALRDGEKVRPLPCVVRAEAAPHLDELVASGERRLRALVQEFPLAVVAESEWRALDPAGGSLQDVDRPEDLAR